MSLSYTKLAAGLAMALAGSLAQANSSGAGAVTSVSYTLIDLDPNDGVTPSITFAAPGGDYVGPHLDGYVRASTPDEDIYREYTRQGLAQTDAVSGGSSTAWSSASSSAIGAAGLGFSALAVSGSALSGVDISGVYNATAEAPAAFFTLSANTQVLFTVTGWLNGETTLGGDPDTGFVENGGAVLQLETRGPSADGSTLYDRQQAAAVAWYTVASDGTVSGEAQSWQGQLVSGYSNTTAGSVDGRFAALLSASGTSVAMAAAVPEPSSVAMILAGLAAVGAVARRRSTQPRA